MSFKEKLIIKTVKSVIDVGPYPYMNTWEDYMRAVEDWTWRLRQAIAIDSLCPRCKFREECVINTNPYETEFCCSYEPIIVVSKQRGDENGSV